MIIVIGVAAAAIVLIAAVVARARLARPAPVLSETVPVPAASEAPAHRPQSPQFNIAARRAIDRQ